LRVLESANHSRAHILNKQRRVTVNAYPAAKNGTRLLISAEVRGGLNLQSRNTDLRFRLRQIWILSLVLSFLYGTGVSGAQPDKEVDRLGGAYQAARTGLERRGVCLDTIDAGVIARDRPVAVVDAIFGTTYAKKLPRYHRNNIANQLFLHRLCLGVTHRTTWLFIPEPEVRAGIGRIRVENHGF
jgi:hypothetical protein